MRWDRSPNARIDSWCSTSPNLTFARHLVVAVLLAPALVTSSFGQQQELLDARTVIRRISENDPEAKIERAEKALAEHARSLADRRNTASSALATEWLALVDEAIALPHRSFNGAMAGMPPQPVGTLLNVLITLPTPQVWLDIRALVAKRPPSLDRTALLMLCARLVGDDEEVLKLCDEYDRLLGPEKREVFPPLGTTRIRMAAARRLGRFGDPRLIERMLGDFDAVQELPNLADLLPPGQLQQVMLHAVQQAKHWVPFRNRQNRRVARQTVLDHLEDLPRAIFDLADDWSDSSYVRQLIDHYGYASLLDPRNLGSSAQKIYFRDLALTGKLEEAARLIQDCNEAPRIDPEDWGAAKDLDAFVAKLQERVPSKVLWDLYESAAVASGHTDKAATRLRSVVADPGVAPKLRLRLLQSLYGLDARQGDLPALARDREMLGSLDRTRSDYDPDSMILGIGLAARDEGLIEDGIQHDLAATGNPIWPGGSLFRALSQQGKWVLLEQLELNSLLKREGNDWYHAKGLCTIYYLAKRPIDVLALLRNYPDWPGKDLSELDNGSSRDYSDAESEVSQPLGFYAAWALSETGQPVVALSILRNLLLRDSQLYHCYALLNKIGGDSLLGIYNDVIQADPCAAMPLLWKGDLLFGLGNTDEAEACLRKAVAIDPVATSSYRTKLYELLGQIRRKKGDPVGAEEGEHRATALGLAARAAELEAVKLLPQARQALEQAVELWPEDAILQARLAEVFVAQCLPERAMEHYRMALENVSECLGNGPEAPSEVGVLFRNARVREMAKVILSRRLLESPESASVHYALGLLDMNLGDTKEAVSDMRKVTDLDPTHVGAWASLASLASKGLPSPTEAQQAVFKLIELNAISNRAWDRWVDLDAVSDLGSAYQAIQTKLGTLPEQDHGPLFALHGAEPYPGQTIFPVFDSLDTRGRLPGSFFQQSDIGQIAQLFHPTRYPFE
ncbi:MAG: hypothetical protein H6534_09985 [Chthonomonadaceae bacterium]|nr:hypothetical protein [Chthonomonadaceae bacterium]